MKISQSNIPTIFAILMNFHTSWGASVKTDDEPHHLKAIIENSNDTVTIYTWDNFMGIPWDLSISNCTDVPAYFYKKASSIDTHGSCAILFSRQQCEGRHVRIAPGTDGHSHLSAVNFDETLASLRLCDKNEEALPQLDGEHPVESSVSTPVLTRSRREVPYFWQLMRRLGMSEGTENDNEDNDKDKDSQEEEDNNPLSMLRSLFASFSSNSVEESTGAKGE